MMRVDLRGFSKICTMPCWKLDTEIVMSLVHTGCTAQKVQRHYFIGFMSPYQLLEPHVYGVQKRHGGWIKLLYPLISWLEARCSTSHLLSGVSLETLRHGAWHWERPKVLGGFGGRHRSPSAGLSRCLQPSLVLGYWQNTLDSLPTVLHRVC